MRRTTLHDRNGAQTRLTRFAFACAVLIAGWAAPFYSRAADDPGVAAGSVVSGTPVAGRVLTTAQGVLDVGLDRARQRAEPVDLTGVVTLRMRDLQWLYLQDATAGMLVIYTNADYNPVPGTLLRVKGWTFAGQFAVHVSEASLQELGHPGLPPPKPADADRLAAGADFGSWVRLRGRVVDMFMPADTLVLRIASGNSTFFVQGLRRELGILPARGRLATEWLDALVEVDGVCWTLTDTWNRPAGFNVNVPSAELVRQIEPGSAELFDRPSLPLAALRPGSPPAARVKVAGTVTYATPEGWIFLQDETGVLLVRLLPGLGRNQNTVVYRDRSYQVPVNPGDAIEAVGFVNVRGGSYLLRDAEYRRVGTGRPPVALACSGAELFAPANESRLVSIRGRVVAQQKRVWGGAEEHVLSVDTAGVRVVAMLRASEGQGLAEVTPYSVCQLTGVSVVNPGGASTPASPVLQLRTAADLAVLRGPRPWDTLAPGRIIAVSGGLGTLALAWIGLLRRQVTQRQRAEHKARRSEATTRTINYFATLLLERNDEATILRDLASNCVAQLGMDNCSIHLIDGERGVLTRRASEILANSDTAIPFGGVSVEIPLGRGAIGRVAQTGRPEIVDTAEPLDVGEGMRPGVGSEIAVPIVNNGEVLGVIASWAPAPGVFRTEHQSLLTSIASLCANKLVRVRAETRLRELNQELEKRIEDRTRELVSANHLLRANADTLRQAEEELLRTLDQERELSHLKTRFVSMVSHELRNPLGVIMCSADILANYLEELPEADRAEHLQGIHQSAARMARLMEEVLFLGRTEAGRIVFTPVPIDLPALCRRTADQVSAATTWRCPLVVTVAPNAVHGEGDENLIVHILTNLLSNAVKYSPASAEVRLEVRREEDRVVLAVSDHGIGIPEKDQPHLYDAFFRGSNAGGTPGTGLGLVIVRRCVELHRGTIAFTSREGLGTTFEVRLPFFTNNRTANETTVPQPINSP